MADNVVRDIPEEMVEAAAVELRDQYDSEHDAAHLSWQDFVGEVRAVLSAALAGRTVVELPEPNVYHADRQHDGPEYGWWPLDAHDVRAFLADGRGRVGSGKPYVRVHNSSGSVVFDAADATAIAAAILAAGPAAEGLAAGSGVGDQT